LTAEEVAAMEAKAGGDLSNFSDPIGNGTTNGISKRKASNISGNGKKNDTPTKKSKIEEDDDEDEDDADDDS